MAKVYFFAGAGEGAESLYVTEDFPVMLASDVGYCSYVEPVVRGGDGVRPYLVLTPAPLGSPVQLKELDEGTFVLLNSHSGGPAGDEVLGQVTEMQGLARPIGSLVPGVAEVVAQFGARTLDSGRSDVSVKLPLKSVSASPQIAWEFQQRFPNCGKMGGGGPAGGNYPARSDYPFIFTQMIARHAQDNQVPFVLDQSARIVEVQKRITSGGGFMWNRPPEDARNLTVGGRADTDGRAEYRVTSESWSDREGDSLMVKAARMVPGFHVGIQRDADLALQEAKQMSKNMDAPDTSFDDLFECHEQLPGELQDLIARYSDLLETGEIDRYEVCREFLEKVQPLGYSFEYGLDGEPYGLRQTDAADFDELAPGPR